MAFANQQNGAHRYREIDISELSRTRAASVDMLNGGFVTHKFPWNSEGWTRGRLALSLNAPDPTVTGSFSVAIGGYSSLNQADSQYTQNNLNVLGEGNGWNLFPSTNSQQIVVTWDQGGQVNWSHTYTTAGTLVQLQGQGLLNPTWCGLWAHLGILLVNNSGQTITVARWITAFSSF